MGPCQGSGESPILSTRSNSQFMTDDNLCINCERSANRGGLPVWFCEECDAVKERAYALSKLHNEDYIDTMRRRDRALREFKLDYQRKQAPVV